MDEKFCRHIKIRNIGNGAFSKSKDVVGRFNNLMRQKESD